MPAGIVYAWGRGDSGRLGLGERLPSATSDDLFNVSYQPHPTKITSLRNHDVVQVVAGAFHSVALTRNGEVLGWGDAEQGKLGVLDLGSLPKDSENRAYQPTPSPVKGLGGLQVVQVACGEWHCLALTARCDVWAWGSAIFGALGLSDTSGLPHIAADETDVFQPKPSLVSGLAGKDVIQLACGDLSSLALTRSGSVWTWGSALFGRLGTPDRSGLPHHGEDETNVYQPTPTLVSGLTGEEVLQVACGAFHTFAVTRKGAVWGWGGATCGKLGLPSIAGLPREGEGEDEDSFYQPTPTMLSGLAGQDVLQVACGRFHSLALTQKGTVWAWGSATFGRLGILSIAGLPHHGNDKAEIYQPTPTLVSGLSGQDVLRVACGWEHSLAVARNGAVWGWGSASYGQLGLPDRVRAALPPSDADGFPQYQHVPIVIETLMGVCDGLSSLTVVAGEDTSFAVVQAVDTSAKGTEPSEPHWRRIMEDPRFADVEFVVGSEGGPQATIHAHRAVLCARSEYWDRQFAGQLAEGVASRGVPVRVEVPDMLPSTMRSVLRWAYTGTLPEEAGSETFAGPDQVLLAADKLQIEGLRVACQARLRERLTLTSAPTTWLVARRASAPLLEASAFAYMVTNIQEVMSSSTFAPVCNDEPALLLQLLGASASPRDLESQRLLKRLREE